MNRIHWPEIVVLVVIAIIAFPFVGHVSADVAPIQCVHNTCVFSTNVPYDSAGTPDTRPGTWGNAGSADTPIPLTNVPEGYRVRVLRIYGDHIAWPHGRIKPGTDAGVLFGVITPSATQSPFVGPGLGASGCFVYLQQGVGESPVRAPFDFDVAAGGLLDPDNVMIVRNALFLNETGASIHMEATFIVEFRYERVR